MAVTTLPQFTFDEFKTWEFHMERMEYYNALLLELGAEFNITTEREMNRYMRTNYMTATSEMQRNFDYMEAHSCMIELIYYVHSNKRNAFENSYANTLLEYIETHREKFGDIYFNMFMQWKKENFQ
jgi:hypothetical protein